MAPEPPSRGAGAPASVAPDSCVSPDTSHVTVTEPTCRPYGLRACPCLMALSVTCTGSPSPHPGLDPREPPQTPPATLAVIPGGRWGLPVVAR